MEEKKNKVIAALFALIIPGSGHLYLGLLRRGIFIMLALAMNIAAIPYVVIGMMPNFEFTYIPIVVVLSLLIPIIYFFNLFDVLQKTDQVNYHLHGKEYSVSVEEELDTTPIKMKGTTIGILLLFFGVILLSEQIFPGFIRTVFAKGGLALILIAGGSYLVYREWKMRG